MNPQKLFKINDRISKLLGKWAVIADGFFGDNGKGRISNFICYLLLEMGANVSWCMRPNGGDNAGHEVFAPWGPYGPQESYKGHIVPMGILQGIPALIGPGAVLNPDLLFEVELQRLAEQGIDIGKVFVSRRTNLVLPIYKLLEQAQEKLKGKNAVGTTGKAIGQTYEFRANRFGLQLQDLFGNIVELKEKIRMIHKLIDPVLQEALSNGFELGPKSDVNESLDMVMQYEYPLSRMMVDEQSIYSKIRNDGSVGVMEMGQGTGLDNIHGSFPFVTSSLTTIPGGIAQAGLSHKDLGYGILVVKGPYFTRVGAGEFPTEMDEETAKLFRNTGKEFGTTTGRPRRCGYTDLVFLRHAVNLNGPDCVCLTKMDITADQPQIKVRVSNPYLGTDKDGYYLADGWNGADVSGVQNLQDIPQSTIDFIKMVNDQIIDVYNPRFLTSLISTGPSLQDIILCPDFLS